MAFDLGLRPERDIQNAQLLALTLPEAGLVSPGWPGVIPMKLALVQSTLLTHISCIDLRTFMLRTHRQVLSNRNTLQDTLQAVIDRIF